MPLEPKDWANEQRIRNLQSILEAARETLETAGLLHIAVDKWIRQEVSVEVPWDEGEREDLALQVMQANDNEKSRKISDSDLEILARREIVKKGVMKWSEMHWGHELEAQFLTERQKLDKASIYVLVVKGLNLALELFHRLKADEATFLQLSQAHGIGAVAKTGGYISLRPLNELPYGLAEVVRRISPGELVGPMSIGNKYVVAKLEMFMPATFTRETKVLLLRRRFQQWSNEVASILVKTLKK